MILQVKQKIGSLRRRMLWLGTVAALSQWAVGVCVLVVGLMGVDRVVELPREVRVVAVGGLGVVSVGFLVVRALRPWVRPPSDEAIALMIERDQPGLRQRLISSLQLAREQPESSLTRRLVSDTEALLAPADLSTAALAGGAIRWVGAAVGVGIVAGLITLALGPLSLRRALGSAEEYPRRTQVRLVNPQLTVARGEAVTIEVEAAGEIPASGELRVSFDRAPVGLVPTTQPGVFSAEVVPADSFEYRAHVGDGVSEEGKVKVAERPALAEVVFEVTPPAYTRLPTTRKFPGDLTFLQGSRLAVRARATKPLAGESVVMAVATTLPTSRPAADVIAAEFVPTAETTSVTLGLTDTDGLSARNLPTYPVTLLPDKPPTLKVIAPTRMEDVVTRGAVVRVELEAGDDVRLASLKIQYVVKGEVGQTVSAGETPLTFRPTNQLAAQYRFPLSTLSLQEGQVLQWRVVAMDGSPGPNVTASEPFTLKIASEAEVRAVLAERLQSTLGALEGTQAAQQELTQDTYQLLQARPTTRAAP